MTPPSPSPELPASAIRVLWPETPQPPQDMPCPNCGAPGPKPHVLDVAWTAPKLPRGDRKPVLACPSCTARFYPPLKVPNYHDPDVMDWGWHQFHIQQGAGLVAITRLLGRISRPPGTRCLEIGCGYGYGLDFTRHALRWKCKGIDPSPMARLGAEDLGIEIDDGYFPDADSADRRWDVIAATEVIEHVQRPSDLLAALRDRLDDDGILLLTTPDGEAIDRATANADLIQLLAPGIHMVFQTEASLRRLLEAAGFGGVRIRREGLTLVAYAGATEDAVIDDDDEQRRRFRAYLAGRAHAVAVETDLGLGFAGRAMFEAAVDLDWPAARVIRGLLRPAIRNRFGIDIDSLETLPDEWMNLPLARLKDTMPLNLGMILYAEASRLRADPALRPHAGATFALAGRASAALHGALARLALNDGLAEELAWRGAAEAAIEAARTGAAETPDRFAALDAPTTARAEIAWRGVVELVNAGAIDLAHGLMQAESLIEPGTDLSPTTRRDAMIVLGQLALEPDSDPLRAIEIATKLGEDDPLSARLLLGGIVRLVNAGRYEQVAPLADRVIPLCAAHADELGTDAANALAIVISKTADPAAIPGLLRPLRLDGHRRIAIILDAFSRLVAAGRHDEAVAMVDAENIVSHAVARDDEAGHDARLALALLDLATGDPMDVPARLTNLDVPLPQRREMLIGAFSRLVNAARYADARRLADETDFDSWSQSVPTAAGADAATNLAILDIVYGDPAAAPARLTHPEIATARRREITIGAFVTLVNRSRYDDATALRHAAPLGEWATAPDEPGREADRALAILDLVTGDPALLPDLLPRLELTTDEALRRSVNAFSKLVNASRYVDASDLAARLGLTPDSPGLTATQRRDLTIGTMLIDIAAGDPMDVLDRVEAIGENRGAVEPILLDAFVRLVNDGRITDAAGFSSRASVPVMLTRADPRLAGDVRLSLAIVDLASGDPGELGARLAQLGLSDTQRRDLARSAFVALVEQRRYEEAIDLASTEGLNDADDSDLALSFALIDLSVGDPARVPDRLDRASCTPAEQTALLAGACIELVNAGRHAEALSLFTTRGLPGKAASLPVADRTALAQAAIIATLAAGDPAALMPMIEPIPDLPATLLDAAQAEAFLRLVNADRRADAIALRTMRDWDQRLGKLDAPLDRDCGLACAWLDLGSGDTPADLANRIDDLLTRGITPEQAAALAKAGFTQAIAHGDFATASRLHGLLGPLPGPFTGNQDDIDRGLLYARGIFLLNVTPTQPLLAEVAFSTIRRAFATDADAQPDALFWEAIRGEMISLNMTDRAAEADALLRTMKARYQNAPQDLH